MAGTKGHSGRKPTKTVAEHKLAGTYRPGRHAWREVAAQPLVFPAPPLIPDALVAGLPGREYVEKHWLEYQFGTASLVLLRIAAEQVDRRALAAKALARQPLVTGARQSAWLRVEQRANKLLLDVLKQMNLETR